MRRAALRGYGRGRAVYPRASLPPVPMGGGFSVQRTGITYQTLAAAISNSIAGDVIVGVCGTYTEDGIIVSKNLTILSSVAGQKVTINATAAKNSIIRVGVGVSLTLEDFALQNNKDVTGFQAGLTTAGNTGTITLRRCKIEECNNGILNANTDFTCVLVLEDCEILNNGVNVGEAATHQMYVGSIASLAMTGCWVHNTRGPDEYNALYGPGNEWRMGLGHLVKSRARITTIRGCRITMENAGSSVPYGASKCFDISNGGDLTIEGCLVEYRTYRDQAAVQLLNWGPEGSGNLPGGVFEADRTFKIKVRQNTFVARSPDVISTSNRYFARWFIGQIDAPNGGTQPIPTPTEYSVIDNIFCGFDSNVPVVVEGPSGGSVDPSVTYAVNLTTNTSGALTLLTDAANYNYRPVTPVNGSQNWAAYSYVHPASKTTRTDSSRGAVDTSIPAWLPAVSSSQGAWGAVHTNTAESIKGNFTYFTSGRDWNGPNGLWADFSGAVWNPHIGTYGAMLFHGGGHATSVGMADNGVYMWKADTQAWSRLVDPTYPGEIPLGDWGVEPWSSALLNTYGELATNVPAANHSRCLPCVLPPSAGGGSQGDFIVPWQSSIHWGLANKPYGHRLNCASAISSGSSAANSAWSRMPVNPFDTGSDKGWAATVDSSRGYVYLSTQASSYALRRLNVATGVWTSVTPSGWVSDNIAGQPLMYAAAHDMLVVFCADFTLRLINAASGTLTMVSPSGYTGTAPTGGAPSGGGSANSSGGVWCPDIGANGAVVHYNPVTHEVKALRAPASPLSGGAWTWTTLASSNTPSGRGDAIYWYNRFQYAPALKSFFLCSMPNDSYGGIVCFRPSSTDLP